MEKREDYRKGKGEERRTGEEGWGRKKRGEGLARSDGYEEGNGKKGEADRDEEGEEGRKRAREKGWGREKGKGLVLRAWYE